MDRLAHHLLTMAYNNAWANHRLHKAVARLSAAELAAPRAGFFPSLKGTLNHILIVDWYYVDALERSLAGQSPNADALKEFFANEEPFAEPAMLGEAQRSVDRRLLEVCGGLTTRTLDADIAIVRSTGVQHENATRVLAHLFEHQIHHRGQAHAMLSSTNIAPPQLDEFFCANDAALRASDFAELGFSEAQIWT